ncbi:MAG: precorrin-6y C5,15-methyltransferase (decarboxylating) subunit CbiE [Phocaeicola sp.]|nr:precorrin-6y C5,15-methyltransferase (decarboxylating) subunit CbiE [Phocaeicola sp.]
MAKSFIVIGLTDTHQPSFTDEILKVIKNGRVFSGGKRHHEIVGGLLPASSSWIDITVPLDHVFSAYQELFNKGVESIIVFASGDPLFYGFANTIKREMPGAGIKLYPTFNSLQMLAHRLVIPYHDMHIVSLTGRPWKEFDRALIEGFYKIGVLTDKEHHPGAIAQRMMDYGYNDFTMYVGEHLGNPEKERITKHSLDEAMMETFDYPNCILLVSSSAVRKPKKFGLPDHEFLLLDGREKMITKMPIRLLTLQALELNRRKNFWDVGFCTGSVSIEARLLYPHLNIVSFEKREEGARLMEGNSRKFGALGITTLIGDFLKMDITSLEKPDAVFVGGHGGRLKEMMSKIYSVLEPGGCIVMNSVTSQSHELFLDAAKELKMKIEPTLHVALNEYNPIDILKVVKR